MAPNKALVTSHATMSVAGAIASHADVRAILAKRGYQSLQELDVRAGLPTRYPASDILRGPGCTGRDSTYTQNPITDRRTKSRFQKKKTLATVQSFKTAGLCSTSLSAMVLKDRGQLKL